MMPRKTTKEISTCSLIQKSVSGLLKVSRIGLKAVSIPQKKFWRHARKMPVCYKLHENETLLD